MSKKDYIAIAKILKRNRKKSYTNLVYELATYFRSENSRFDLRKFLNAVEVED